MLNVRSHSSLLLVTMLPPPLTPALLNNKWILSVWWRLATSSRNRSTCVRSATSAVCVVTRSPCGNPAASHSLCVSARPVGETSHIATLQASATSWRTSSRPIPLPPPVTTAVLPTNSVMCVLPCVLAPIQIWPCNLPAGRRQDHAHARADRGDRERLCPYPRDGAVARRISSRARRVPQRQARRPSRFDRGSGYPPARTTPLVSRLRGWGPSAS